jgi:N-acetyl-anhydromuramyl-L-alanine amidase AmpD
MQEWEGVRIFFLGFLIYISRQYRTTSRMLEDCFKIFLSLMADKVTGLRDIACNVER